MRDSNGLFELRQTTSVSPCLRVSVLKMTLEKPTLISTHMNGGADTGNLFAIHRLT